MSSNSTALACVRSQRPDFGGTDIANECGRVQGNMVVVIEQQQEPHTVTDSEPAVI